jgi:Dockerin type I domain
MLRLDGALLPLPVNDGRGGDDSCGTLLLGGTGDQRARAVIATSPGRYLVAAEEIPPDPAEPARVFASAFDAGAAPLWPDVVIRPADPANPSLAPFATPDGAGGSFIGWQESSDPEGLSGQVRINRFDADGLPLWAAPVVLSTITGAMARDAQIVPDGGGGVFVAWSEWRDAAPFPVTLLQHLDRTGARLWAPKGVPVDPVLAVRPPVSLLPDARGLVVMFLADRPRAQRYTPAGSPALGSGGVLLAPDDSIARAELHALAVPGTTYATWVETPPAGGGRLAIARLLADDSPAWPSPLTLLARPDVLARTEAILPDGGLLTAAVVRARGAGDPTDLVVQSIDARGRIKTSPEGAPLAVVTGAQTHPLLLLPWTDVSQPAAPAPGAGVIWSDARPGTGVNGADAWFTQSLLVTSAPRVDPPSPAPEIRQGDERIVILTGDDLWPGLTADAGRGIDAEVVAVAALSVNGPGDRLALRLRVGDGAAIGPRAIRIANPDGGATAAAILVVTLDTDRIDIDGSGRADGRDLAILARAFGRFTGDPGYDAAADIDGSGVVDGLDLAYLAGWFGSSPPHAQ